MRSFDDEHIHEINDMLCDKLLDFIGDFLRSDMKDFDFPSQCAVVINSFMNLLMFTIQQAHGEDSIKRKKCIERMIERLKEMDRERNKHNKE